MSEPSHRVRFAKLLTRKSPASRITALTAYDAPTARILDACGVEMLFVGDSVGTNVLGYQSEREVTLADIAHHVGAVRRGAPDAVVLADLPYQTYGTPSETVANAGRLIGAGATLVKVEGADQSDNIRALTEAGIPVCAHLGFTPQSLNQPGTKARVQARSVEDALALIDAAGMLADAGASMLVLELIPAPLATIVTERIKIPTIGIGAGPGCDGQVLIVHDILGLSGLKLRIARQFADGDTLIRSAVTDYVTSVRDGSFPADENTFAMDSSTIDAITGRLGDHAAGRPE